MNKLLLIIICSMLILLQTSCTVLYNRLYYVPQKNLGEWTYSNRLNQQDPIGGSRDFSAIHKTYKISDSLITQVQIFLPWFVSHKPLHQHVKGA